MISSDRVRLSLLLPLASPRDLLAASQVVVFVLAGTRVELDLVRGRAGAARRGLLSGPGAVLFVAADLDIATSDSAEIARYERDLRARIERAYARQGIVPVDYDLQLG